MVALKPKFGSRLMDCTCSWTLVAIDLGSITLARDSRHAIPARYIATGPPIHYVGGHNG
jgi:hypothetical protein